MSYAINILGSHLSAPSNNVYNFGSGNFTLQCWVKTSKSGTVISRKSTDGGPGNGGFLLVIKSNGSIKLATDNGFGFFEIDTSPTNICNNQWHFLTGVRNANVLTIYLDGNPVVGSNRGNATPPLNVNNNLPLYIGAVAQQQEEFNQFTGQLDEVRLWNYALSQDQIKSMMNTQLTGNESGLVAYYTFNDQNGNDSSNTRNTASAIGNISYTSPGAIGNTPASLIDGVRSAVSNYFNHLSGEAYVRILDTPHVWGQSFGNGIMPQAFIRQAEFERAIHEIIQKAKYRCDISSLNSPDPDWARAILSGMDTSLSQRLGRTKPTQFRFFFGQTPTTPVGEPTNYSDFKASIIRLFRERSSHWEVIPEIWFGRFYKIQDGIIASIIAKIFSGPVIGSFDDGEKMTWNHTKIISVDGTEALVGGHNLNMDLFRSYPPVHDVSNVVHGEAAYGPQLFLNQMWVCGTDLLTKESLNTSNLTWTNRDEDSNTPTDPLIQTDAIAYMKNKQDTLIAMHQSGIQTGVDEPYDNGEKPIPSGIRQQDLQSVTDLSLPVFRYRAIYNTYQGWSEYKKSNRMLTLGKYWNGPSQAENFQQASEVMKEYLIKNAKHSIKMSQMDIVSAWKKNWSDHHVCIWVLEALLANPNLQVQIVVSPLDAGAGAAGDQYSFGSGASRTFDLLKYYMTHDVASDAVLPDPDGKRANALSRLQVAPFYFTDQVPANLTIEGETYKWPNLSAEGYTATLKQKPLADQPPVHGVIGSAAWSVVNASGYLYDKVPSAPGNHSKIMIIDDEIYVIGSDNLYPGFLSEIDYLIEGADAVNQLISAYWAPLWRYSGPHAISGTSDTASVDISYLQNNNQKIVNWTLNLSMSLLELKQKIKNELNTDGHVNTPQDINLWGENNTLMTSDSQILRNFGLSNGDRISVANLFPANAEIAIRTQTFNLLTVVNAGGLMGQQGVVAFSTNSTSVGAFEKLKVVLIDGKLKTFALQTANGRYVTAVNGGGIGGPNDATSTLHTDATGIGPWEKIVLEPQADNTVALRTINRYYLSAINGGDFGEAANQKPIHTDASAIGPWETFTSQTVD
jgi:phosphatidylserine/phosphatidylglycerophosphate/cardiolipin synthase-like enzyme